jgi:hypothetical protein
VRLANLTLEIDVPSGPARLPRLAAALHEQIGAKATPLRISIVGAERQRLQLEVTVARFVPGESYADELAESDLLEPRRKSHQAERFAVAQIVPTGIRCDFGGYAGDATPATNLLAAAADLVVTHPNAVNASDMNEMAPNVLYVEGHSLDAFMLGRLGLRLGAANRVGTFFDPTGAIHLDEVVHVVNAAKAAAGISCEKIAMLDAPVGARVEWSPSGSAGGQIAEPRAVLDGVARLLGAGCDAVGGVSVIHGVTRAMCERHMRGEIPNPSGVVEAILTHLVSKVFRVPCAHAPLPYYQETKDRSTANPRASAEFISTPHYFSVLKGLAKAPRLVAVDDLEHPPAECVTVNSIGAVVAPATALGGLPALAAEFHGIPLVAVRENTTILAMTAARLGLENVIEVESYLEAAGVVLALRRGISLESLRRPIARAEVLAESSAPERSRARKAPAA